MKKVLHILCAFSTGLFALFGNELKAQSSHYLGIEHGLSNNAVTSVYKDKHGFIWLGTYDGLNRYDGSVVTIFRNIWQDTTSLADNHINRLTGYKNKVFAGTLKGAVYFDYSTSKFSHIYYKENKEGPRSKITGNVTALQADAAGNIFIGTEYTGLFIYNSGNTSAYRVQIKGHGNDYSVQSVTVDATQNIWLFVRNVGLCRLNKIKKEADIVNPGLRYANCLITDNKGKIWIGTDNGLYQYSMATGNIEKNSILSARLNNENITDIKFVKSNNVWIGTNGGGVNVLDTVKKTVRYITSNRNPASNGLRSDAVSLIYEDNQQLVWVATLRGGTTCFDTKKNAFRLITHDPFSQNSVVNNFILSFCDDSLGNLLIGTDGGGLSVWNRKYNTFTNYSHNADNASLKSNFVVSIVKDSLKRIWVATFNGGIDQFDNQTGKFIHYKCFNTATGTEDKNLWKLYVDRRNNLWAGSTRGGALYKFNSAKNKFELFDERLINIHALFEDSGGDLWAGDYSNLIRIDRSGKRHQYLSVRNAVRSITEDRWHNLWLGTEGGGLLKYIKATGKFVRYTQANGLPSNSVLNVLMDDKDRLWASTYNGLSEYNVQSNTFKNYDVSDGLQSNQFNFNAALKLRSGELVFGGINGFNVFHPDSINQYQSKPSLKIIGLQVNNKQLLGASKVTDYKGIIDMAKLLVSYNDATIAISYTVPEYSFAEKISYAYYLEGWDHGWNNVGKLKTAYYTRLNEGTYKLRIRAQNSTNPALSNEISLQITVMPPWYRTWWAYLLYFIFISLVIYLIRMYRIRQAGLKYEVTLANLNVEREKELNEKKLSFFTNISHEFRTPLTLIINPIKDLLKTNSTDTRDELNTIYRNARRLLGLVDQLLLFRKTESENDTLHIVKCDFAKICQDTFNCFSYQAKVKSIHYNYSDDDQQLTVAADKEKLEIAIFNLIANAIKFTPVGGTINIMVGAVNGKLSVKIEDSGCGVKEEIGDRLFDKFYQVKDNTSLKTGFGIGLYLTKNFIEKHGGSISYFPNNLQGTTFVVEIPHNPVINDDDAQPSILSDNQLISEMVEEIESSEMAEEHYEQLPLLISERQTILVIDDNENLRSYIKKIFKDEFRMIEASNGEEGLSITRKHIPDLIICDVKMDGISGIEFCDIIKKDTSLNHIPVILLTGEADLDIRLKSIEVGAVDFVNKPFEKDILMARVRGILRDRKELQNYFYNEVTLKFNTRNISEDHKEFLYKCVSVIENKIIEPDFDVKTIADELGMSYSSLFKKLKAITGQSVNNFVRFVRLRKAAEMMINTNCNVNEAALNAGFNDIKYFREQFVKLFGVKPSDFIKQHRNAFNKNFTIEQSFK